MRRTWILIQAAVLVILAVAGAYGDGKATAECPASGAEAELHCTL